MKKVSFEEALERILKKDASYHEQAYHFVRESLDFTVKMMAKPTEGPGRHVSGAELLDGIRQYALQELGPISKTVLNRWGVTRPEDFGQIVFNLVNEGILGKTDEDKVSDFAGAYTFEDAFVKPFQPKEQLKPSRRQTTPSRERID